MTPRRSWFGVGAALALVGACSSDLFHSTDWPTACADDPGLCGTGGAMGPGSMSGSHPTSSASSGAGGSGGAPATGSGAASASSGASTGPSSTSASSGTGGATGCTIEEWEFSMNLHCFRFVSTAAPWDTARADCLANGADLASITSVAENDFIGLHVAGSSWVGGNDGASEGTWVWSNGDGFSYSNWNPGEPNNAATGGENCLQFYGPGTGVLGLWNDNACTTPLAYVCERVP